MKKCTIVVDMQNDFVSGALGFPNAQTIVTRIKAMLQQMDQTQDLIFTLDTHDLDYLTTQEGRNLPVEHCIKGTWGHEIVKELHPYIAHAHLFEKPTFGSLELANYLETQSYDEISICGLVSNICVISTAVLAKAALPEAKIVVDSSLTDSFDPELHSKVLDVLRGLQVQVI